jgi:hypothetical protein
MADFRMYRTYRWLSKEKNPVIDKTRTILQDEGLFKNLSAVADISGLARATLDGWYTGDVRNPHHSSIMALLTSVGYEEQFVKIKDIDVEKERTAGKNWLAERAKQREASRPKTNGHRKPRKSKAK